MRRRLAIEVGSRCCGIGVGAAGPEVTWRVDDFAAVRASGGKIATFGDQNGIGGDIQGRVIM
jgi:hypothetical protein